MIFSIAEYTVWDIYPIRQLLLFCLVPVFFLIPQPRLVWPFSNFSLFRKSNRWTGVAVLIGVSLMTTSHFLFTLYPVMTQQSALNNGDFETLELAYDGPTIKAQTTSLPRIELTLNFEGNRFQAPGSLYGVGLLPCIRENLTAGERYRLNVKDNVVLQILSDHGKESGGRPRCTD